MLVVISDLHLTDGTCGPSVSPHAFELFAAQLRSLAESASWRADGHYRPLERIDLLLLGDVLDLLHSNRWAERSDVRPWDGADRPGMVEVVGRIAGDIVQHNQRSIEILRSIGSHRAVMLAPADLRGRPVTDAPPMPVSVHSHYMVGDHDWFLHLSPQAYDGVRAYVIEQLGLANRAEVPFAHDAAEDDVLLEVQRRHRVVARHGDLFDPLCYEEDRGTCSLADVLAIELLAPFIPHLAAEMKEHLPNATAMALVDLHHVRPLLAVPEWLDALVERTCSHADVRKRIRAIWDRMVDRALDVPMVRESILFRSGNQVDALRQALKCGKRSVPAAAKLDGLLGRHRETASYASHALMEQDFRNRRARSIIYGHTHQAESVPLDASFADGYVLNQVYFNAGTWRRTMRPTMLGSGRREFIACDSIGCTAFFQGDERGGRAFETWQGTLGVRPTGASMIRVDASAEVAAAPAAHSPAPIVAPHFVGAGRVTPVRRQR